MRATFRGALAALSLIAVGGCAGTGVQTPTEAHSASVSPAVQEVLDVIHSDASRRLLTVADEFDKEYCEVHLRRRLDTPEMLNCVWTRDQLGKLADQLESDLRRLQPVPAELDELVTETVYALSAVRVLARPDEDPEVLTFTLRMVRDELGSWSAVAG